MLAKPDALAARIARLRAQLADEHLRSHANMTAIEAALEQSVRALDLDEGRLQQRADSVFEGALQAKVDGNRAFQGGAFQDAMMSYTCGIGMLIGDVPVVDFGLCADSLQPLPLRCAATDASELAAMLLTNRAAAALKLGLPRPIRALVDTAHAQRLHPGPKPTFRRAQALLAVGACSEAAEILAGYCEGAAPDCACTCTCP